MFAHLSSQNNFKFCGMFRHGWHGDGFLKHAKARPQSGLATRAGVEPTPPP